MLSRHVSISAHETQWLHASLYRLHINVEDCQTPTYLKQLLDTVLVQTWTKILLRTACYLSPSVLKPVSRFCTEKKNALKQQFRRLPSILSQNIFARRRIGAPGSDVLGQFCANGPPRPSALVWKLCNINHSTQTLLQVQVIPQTAIKRAGVNCNSSQQYLVISYVHGADSYFCIFGLKKIEW